MSEDILSIVNSAVEKIRALPDYSEKFKGWDKVIQIKTNEGDALYLHVTENGITVGQGEHENPSVTLTASRGDMLAIIKGELDGVKAFFSGRLKIQGDAFVSQKFDQVLKEALK